MAVYGIAFVIARSQGGVTVVKPYMQVVTLGSPRDSILDAVEYVRDNYQLSKNAEEGWELLGDPVYFDFHLGLWKDWGGAYEPCSRAKKTKRSLTSDQITAQKRKTCIRLWAAFVCKY